MRPAFCFKIGGAAALLPPFAERAGSETYRMILSMTGFGDAQREEAGHVYHIELRCVNNRYFKASISLPTELAFLEPELERLLRQRITRGSVHARVYLKDTSAAAAKEINAAAIRSYVQQLRAAGGDDPRTVIDLAALAALPGVMQPQELSIDERARMLQVIEDLANRAIEKLIESRTVEGAVLAADLRSNCGRLRGGIAAVRGRVPVVVDEYRQRLLSRVNELLATSNIQLAEEGLQREVALYADRSDISEELTRLSGHLDAFDVALAGKEPAGRRLDFVVQEMLREANTMGAKSGDAEIARQIIDMKTAIDRMKEQVQNVE